MNQVKTGTFTKKSEDINFKESFEYYLQHAKIHFKENTRYHRELTINKHFIPTFGDKKLNDITPPAIKNWITDKIEEGCSASVLNCNLKTCKATFNLLIKDNLINKNPFKHIQKLREIREEPRFLTIEEVEVFLEKAKDYYPKFYPLLYLAIFTGMRQGEMLALSWDDINWKRRKIMVNKSYSRGQLGPTKTYQTREVDTPDNLIKVLKEWQLKCSHNDKNLIFPNTIGNYKQATHMLRDSFKPALEKAKIGKMRFHDLRHTYASLLIAKNVPVKYIQAQLGHASIKVTMDTYGHLMPEVNEKAISVLNNIFQDSHEEKEQDTLKKLLSNETFINALKNSDAAKILGI